MRDRGESRQPGFAGRGGGTRLPAADLSALDSSEFIEEYGLTGQRVLAKALDLLLIAVIQAVVVFPIYLIGLLVIIGLAETGETESGEVGAGFLFAFFGLWMTIVALSLAIAVGYHFFMEYRSQQTVGKRAFDLKVLNDEGGRASGKQILIRSILTVITLCFPLWVMEILVMSLREDGRRLTDMITGTKIVKVITVYHYPATGNA